MQAAAATTANFSKQVDAAAARSATSVSRFGQVAGTVGKVTTLAVAGGLALSAKAAIDFESSFAGVRKTLDATEPQFARLADNIIALSTQIPINANELNRIAELGGQLGVGVGGIADFTETIAELGVTTTLTTETAALGLARLDNILNLNQQSFDRLGSSLVDLGNNFAATEDEILTFSLRIAPVGQTVGLTADEVLALGTAFSSVGVPAERGGTAVQRVLIEIADAAKTGGEELELFAQVAGVSVGDFVDLVETDMARAFELFVNGLGEVDAAGGNVFQILRDLDLGNNRTVQSILAVANAQGVLNDALATSEREFEANLALTEEAEKRFETTASKIELAKNQFNALRIEVGQNLLPVIGDLAIATGDFLVGIRNADPAIRNTATALLALTAGLTIANFTTKLLARSIGVQLVGAMGAATLAGFALRATLGGIVLLITGIAFSAISRFGTAQREAEIRTQGLVEALKAEREGLEGASVAAIKKSLIDEGRLDQLNRLGIGAETFAKAVAGDEEALSKVFDVFSDIRTQREALLEESGGSIIGDDAASRRDAERLEELEGLLVDVDEAQTNLGQLGTEFVQAQGLEQTNRLREEESFLLDQLGRNWELLPQSVIDATLATRTFNETVQTGALPTFEETEEVILDVSDALSVFSDSISDAFDVVNERVIGGIAPWDEYKGAVELNLQDVAESFENQVLAIGQSEALRNALVRGGAGQTILDVFDTLGLGERQFLSQQFFGDDAEASKQVSDLFFGTFAEGFEKLDVIAANSFKVALPAAVREGVTSSIAELNEAVDASELEGQAAADAWAQGFVEFVASGEAEFGSSFTEEAVRQLVDSDFLGEMFGIGKNAVSTLVAGILEQLGIEDLSIIGRSVVQGTASALQIESPSRVMMEMGFQTGQGFLVGLRNASDRFALTDLGLNLPRTTGVGSSPVANTVTHNGGSTVVNVTGSGGDDLASDIGTGLIIGGITRHVEVLGSG